ncbi:hypothetical protein [Actinophytocola algeriensis]|uniref:Uncharacterized protein n=1 Tax=Actinophytocola algeriensis TaxID=1768010 RepID=A0A7W7VEK5_9PSEU|nr:hypothetical protein [Actinophytocola algeriensis]MBB4907351.1 hypothetical protein [Actinophytocola algeriensis]MBE1478834.1 hypothetical protein [Actinophytocola algeriensis]
MTETTITKDPTNPQPPCAECGSTAHTTGHHEGNAEPMGHHEGNSIPTGSPA